MGGLVITLLLLGSFIGAALVIRCINTRTARSATTAADTSELDTDPGGATASPGPLVRL